MPGINIQVSPLISNPNPYPDGQDIHSRGQNLAFAGTTQTTAAPILRQISMISNNTATNGGILPVATAGQSFYVIPTLGTNSPLVYPPVGGSLNFGAVNAPLSIPVRSISKFVAIDNLGNYALMSAGPTTPFAPQFMTWGDGTPVTWGNGTSVEWSNA